MSNEENKATVKFKYRGYTSHPNYIDGLGVYTNENLMGEAGFVDRECYQFPFDVTHWMYPPKPPEKCESRHEELK